MPAGQAVIEGGYEFSFRPQTEPYAPGINCDHCGRFVGRDGVFDTEELDVIDGIVVVSGRCAKCLAAS